MDNSISLPTEILTAIIEEFITIHKATPPRETDETDFKPRCYLTPLLRVNKLWHSLSERFLYRCISIGRAIFHKRRGLLRKGYKVAEELLATLIANARLAALVESLHLGIDFYYDEESEWTRTIVGILRVCPTVKHVHIGGIDSSYFDRLYDILKEKSLISFRIDHYDLSDSPVRGQHSTRFLEVMPKWPKLRTIIVSGFNELQDEQNIPVRIDVPSCCPDLREIRIDGKGLRDSDFHSLRALCNNVTKLSIVMFDRWISERVMEELCSGIRAWSSTLRYLKLRLRRGRSPNKSLGDALSTLKRVEELQIYSPELILDLGSIANLVQLERLCISPYWGNAAWPIVELPIGNLAEHLEDQRTFPALKHVLVRTEMEGSFGKRLEDVCAARGIKLAQQLRSRYV